MEKHMKFQTENAAKSARKMSRLVGNNLVEEFIKAHEIEEYRIVDISRLSALENKGLSAAILLFSPLPKDYVLHFEARSDHGIFSQTEHRMDTLADKFAECIRSRGYQAVSQSEKSILDRNEFCIETKTTYLPHKKVAVLSGIGWIGKSNLLVTEKYGSALCMCCVLTDMPLDLVYDRMQEVRCDSCSVCKEVCPRKVLTGKSWTPNTKRDEIVDVYHCETCLKCMVYCRFSQAYARKS